MFKTKENTPIIYKYLQLNKYLKKNEQFLN